MAGETVALKLAFTPLTHMSYESMRKMQAIQPKMKSIQERYKNDPTKELVYDVNWGK